MWHNSRTWQIFAAENAEWLAEALTQSTWCGCNGFSLEGYLFVNDATSGDGAQEYGVLRNEGDRYVQIESMTFSWMTPEQGLELIHRVLAGQYDEQRYGFIESQRIQTPECHGRCHLCQ